jgi:poly-beta-hydroxybutyrate-responsive repressor
MCEDNSSGNQECPCKRERTPNFVQPRVLLELAKKPAHGYELIERLSKEGGGPPEPGNFYRMLRSLEEDGLVSSTWKTQNTGPARRVYELTDQGLDFLQTWAVTIHQTQQMLGLFLSEYESLRTTQFIKE